jgi:hypothetical protein
MKILGWLLFGTSCVLFTQCFVRQQFCTPPQDEYAASQQTAENWRRILESEEADNASRPATRPADDARSTFAATDLGDATK